MMPLGQDMGGLKQQYIRRGAARRLIAIKVTFGPGRRRVFLALRGDAAPNATDRPMALAWH